MANGCRGVRAEWWAGRPRLAMKRALRERGAERHKDRISVTASELARERRKSASYSTYWPGLCNGEVAISWPGPRCRNLFGLECRKTLFVWVCVVRPCIVQYYSNITVSWVYCILAFEKQKSGIVETVSIPPLSSIFLSWVWHHQRVLYHSHQICAMTDLSQTSHRQICYLWLFFFGTNYFWKIVNKPSFHTDISRCPEETPTASQKR